MFVITITELNPNNPTKSIEYVGIDSQSGGYPYWTNFLENAKIFKSADSAKEFLNSSDFTHDSETTDGNVYPPRMIHSGLDLSNQKTFGEGVIQIKEITLTPVFSKPVSGMIKYSKRIAKTQKGNV